jgi:hypothetical protein
MKLYLLLSFRKKMFFLEPASRIGEPFRLHQFASDCIRMMVMADSLDSSRVVLLRTFCSIDHCDNDRFDGGLKAGPDIHYLGEVRREAGDWKGIEGDRHHCWHLVTWELT